MLTEAMVCALATQPCTHHRQIAIHHKILSFSQQKSARCDTYYRRERSHTRQRLKELYWLSFCFCNVDSAITDCLRFAIAIVIVFFSLR